MTVVAGACWELPVFCAQAKFLDLLASFVGYTSDVVR